MFIEQLPSSLVEIPKTAMILAAGHGRRMLPLTERIPKPMLVILGKTILDRSIDNLFCVGVTKIIINVKLSESELLKATKKRTDPTVKVSGLPIHENIIRKNGVKYKIFNIHFIKKLRRQAFTKYIFKVVYF